MKFIFVFSSLFLGVAFGQTQEKYLTINPNGHRGTIKTMAVDKNGNIITGGSDKTIKVWNSKEGYLEREILGQIGPGSEGLIYNIALSPDNKYLLVCGWFGNTDGNQAVGDIRVYNYKTGKLIKLLKGHINAPFKMEFFSNSRNFIAIDFDGNTMLWDVETEQYEVLENVPNDVSDIVVSGITFITTHNSGLVLKWDPNKPEKPIDSYKSLEKDQRPAMHVSISPTGHRIAISSINYVFLLNDKMKEIYSFYHGEDPITQMDFSPDGKRILIASSSYYLKNNLMKVYEEMDEKWFALSAYKKHADAVQCAKFIDNGTCVTAGGVENEIAVWKVEPNKKNSTELQWFAGVGLPIHSVGMNGAKISFSDKWIKNDGFSDFQKTFELSDRLLKPYDMSDSYNFPKHAFSDYSFTLSDNLITLNLKKSGKIIKSIARDNFNGSMHWVVTFVNEKYLVSGGGYGIIEAYDLTGNKVCDLVGHDGDIRGLSVSTDGKFLISGSQDQTIRLWKTEEFGSENKMYPIVSIFIGQNGEWVIWNEDGYFTSSKKGASYVGYHINQGRDKEAKFYPFEQFDIKYNRPDIIMESIGIVDASIIELYHSAYLKRLKRMNLTEEQLSGELHVPIVQLKSSPVSKEKISLSITASDSLNKLKSVHVFLNDVPVYGRNGFSIEEKSLLKINQSIELDLMAGLNKIQVSVTNVVGVESFKETININNTVETESNLFVVSLGVSEYKNTVYNLDYAAKDAVDVNALFATNSCFENINSKVLINAEVTKENIVGLKSFLAQANRNDVVIFFIAGHGVLNKNLDYYFCTHDMDFLTPEKFGITYAELEVLFDGIKAIRKLLIMDTCHSGEVDKDDVEEVAFVNSENEDIAFRNTNTTTTIRETQGLQKTNEAVKEMFNDLRTGTGATVISSAGGAEYAMESDEWKNGLFTYCLLEGITTKNADADKNGEIMLSELQNYISVKVAELSKGRQMPTSRFENLNLDYRIW